jgi:proline dehydrogenase
MLRSLLLYLSAQESPKLFLTTHAVGRRLARRFIAGEDSDDAIRVVRQLNDAGFSVTLDHLGESVREGGAAEEAFRVYLDLLDRLAAEKLNSHVSVKLTQLGLEIDDDGARRRLEAISARAAQYGNFVRIDMESSAYTEKILRLFREVNAPRETLGVALQAYLYRTEKDAAALLKLGARLRLVKGAYKEPPDIAFPRKSDVDRNFLKLAEKLLSSGIYHAIATHDPHMIAGALAVARARGLSRDQFEFQMLYGIRRKLQRELLRRGWRVRIYVPYGKQWYPYFMRRLAERPANLVFLLRNLFRN